jgi:hypothetical protein
MKTYMTNHIEKSVVQTAAGQWVYVSTVQLPTVLCFNGDPYETMVFPYDNHSKKVSSWLDLQCNTAPILRDAQLQHAAAVAKWAAMTELYDTEN